VALPGIGGCPTDRAVIAGGPTLGQGAAAGGSGCSSSVGRRRPSPQTPPLGGGCQNRPAPNALACDRPPPSVPRASPASAGCRGRGTATPASQYGSSQFGAGSAPGSAEGSARGSVRRLLRSFPRVGGVDWKIGSFLDRGVDRQSYWVRSLPGTEASVLKRRNWGGTIGSGGG